MRVGSKGARQVLGGISVSDDGFARVVNDDRPEGLESDWSSNQRIVLAALGAGRSYREAAIEAGVSTRTVARWMTDAEFRGEVALVREEQVTRLTVSLLTGADRAVGVVTEELESEESS